MTAKKNLTIHAIDCKVHSAGVDEKVLNQLGEVIEAAAAIGGKASAAFTGPVGAAIGAALGAAGALIGGVFDLAVAIDRAGDEPDQLYLNLNNLERRHKIWPPNRDYSEIRSQQIIRPNFTFTFTDALDINFWEYDSGSDDDFLGRFTVDSSHIGGVRYQVVARPSEGAVYVVVYSVDDIPVRSVPGALVWYKHIGWTDATQASAGPLQVGDGWAGFKSVFATSEGVIYAIQPDGKLLWYRQTDYQNGVASFRGAIHVGSGWAGFKSVFATSEGVIYAIQPDGSLRWYIHNGWLDGTERWADPAGGLQVGSGWAGFKSVFATSEGVIYAIQPDGKLLWYRHISYNNRNDYGGIQGPIQVGEGWAGFKSVFATRNGTIYAVQSDGTLLWYYHQGWQDGAVSWAGPVPVGTGWQTYKSTFATSNGILYGINT